MLLDSAGNIIGEPNVKFSLAILNDVNAISCRHAARENWLRGRDLNPRPSGYEPDELPGCSTPRLERFNYANVANGRKLKTQKNEVLDREKQRKSSGRHSQLVGPGLCRAMVSEKDA